MVTNIKNEVVYAIDIQGYYWSFKNSNFNIRNEIKILMCVNHTRDISDDTIEKVVQR